MFSYPTTQLCTALGVLLSSYFLVPYFLDPYDYRRRFSGPWLAGLTNWWFSHQVSSERHLAVLQELHARYGTFVRIGPNHISISDPEALAMVYAHGSGLLKTDFYQMFRVGSDDIFNTQDKAEHSKKRRRIANIFSPQSVLAFEPRVRNQIRHFIAQFDIRCEAAKKDISGFNWTANDGKAAIDCASQLSYLALDIISDLASGEPFGLIQAQKDVVVVPVTYQSGQPTKSPENIHVIESIVSGAKYIMKVGVYQPWTRKIMRFLPWNFLGALEVIDFVNFAASVVEARLYQKSRELDAEKTGIDLIDKLLDVKDDDGSSLSKPEIYAESRTLLIAGSDTTANSLSGLCYYLATHPECQRRLQEELDSHIPVQPHQSSDEKGGLVAPSLDAVAKFEQIKNLPYLNACLKEALRLFSTVGTGLPRVVPPGKTFVYGGETFAAGSIVSVPSFCTNRSSVWGPDAEEFRPERWLDKNSASLTKYFVPFSVGPRACIGRNLANMDMLLIAATMFRRYEITALPQTKLNTQDLFIREVHECVVAIKRRE